MKITVDIPDQLRLGSRDSIDLIVGNGLDRVTVYGDGRIEVHGNGGGAPSLAIDVPTVLRELHGSVRQIG